MPKHCEELVIRWIDYRAKQPGTMTIENRKFINENKNYIVQISYSSIGHNECTDRKRMRRSYGSSEYFIESNLIAFEKSHWKSSKGSKNGKIWFINERQKNINRSLQIDESLNEKLKTLKEKKAYDTKVSWKSLRWTIS